MNKVIANNFSDALREFRSKPYAWPSVSCVAFIEILSKGMKNRPDYSKWKKMLEANCMLEISRMPGDRMQNYADCHDRALGGGWIDAAGAPQTGDILFVKKAWGLFAVPDADGFATIHWESDKKWGATIFPAGNGKFYGFSPEHGLKLLHGWSGIVKHKRRGDA